ncbi:MAG: hypothetical protein RLZZ299_1350 [Pseudomonadota bacterium]|jgi:arylsulfatase A-like enzyme
MRRALRWLAAPGVLLIAAWVWYRFWGPALPPERPWARDRRVAATDAAALRAAMETASRLPDTPRPPPGSPDVVFIVLDTFRADLLTAYGRPKDDAVVPHLDAWAAESRVWTNMLSSATWTLPSHATMFTGQLPYTHGAGYAARDAEPDERPLPQGADTLAGRFAAAGWRTVGIAANKAFVRRRWGLAQGFQVWLGEDLPDASDGLPYLTADRVVALATQALSTRRDRPIFLFLNLMDVHAPYVSRRGFLKHPERLDRRLLPGGRGWSRVHLPMRLFGWVHPAARASLREAYDAEARFLDAELQPLLARLPALGVGARDVVLLTADHGEYLGDHAFRGHAQDVYEPVLRVPLVARGPGFPAGTDLSALQTRDVPDLLLGAAGLPMFASGPRASALQVAELYGSLERDLREPWFGARFDRVRRAFRLGSRKVIVGSDGSLEAYDVRDDPHEARSMPDAPWVSALRREGEGYLSTLPVADVSRPLRVERDMDADAALEALGYVDGDP